MPPLDSTSLASRFPALAARPEVAYLDSASTSQKPDTVVGAVARYLSHETANAGRGGYPWGTRLTSRIEDVRVRAAAFLGASPDEIVFTSGATAALNAVALSWGLVNLADGDEILYSPRDHASAVAPWVHLRDVLDKRDIEIKLLPYARTGTGEADLESIRALASPRTRLIVSSHLHNVYGSVTTLEELDLPGVLRCFDCSQSAGHLPLDVTALRADFAAFSAHKMFGAPGAGILYANRRTHGDLAPFLPGGTTAAVMPGLLEGGTPDLGAILALGAALDFVTSIGLDAIAEHDRLLTRRLIDRLRDIPGVRLLPGVAAGACEVGYGIVAFTVDGVSASDVGFICASENVYVRTGAHCLADGAENAVRASTHVYTGAHEVDRFAALINRIAEEAPPP